jgi:hypothetical protein
MRKRKALKGGYIIGQTANSGPALKEPLNKINDDKLKNIKETYDGLLEKSKEDVDLALAIKKAREQEYDAVEKANLTKFATAEKSFIENKKLAFKALSGFLGFISKFIGSVINFLRQFTAYAIKQLFHGGQGVFLKAFMAIVVIIGIFVGFTYSIDLFNNDTALSSYNDIRQNIINTDYEKYLTMPNSDTYMAKIQDKMSSMIPNSFKYKWSSFYNSASHMVTGKNKYDSYLEERQEINTGRCDDIFHINFKEPFGDYLKERTYSIIAPKNVILKYNNNLYNDSDYNRIDSNIKVLVNNYHSTCIIPIKANVNTGKYELKLNSNMYLNDRNGLLLGQSNLIKPIFDNDLKFASFNNISYTGYYDSSSIISSYSTKLINPNYKGPILRLTSAYDIRNQNNKNEKTANFYNEYNKNDLYCIILDKKISYKDFFASKSTSSIYVAALYDQSGNNHNFIFKENDNKYMPEYIDDNKIIKFYIRSILFLSKPIVSKNMKINAKMSVLTEEIVLTYNEATKDNYVDTYMSFLATNTEAIAKIVFKDNQTEKLYLQYKDDINQKSNNYNLTDNKTKLSNIEFNFKSDNDIMIETLGNILDIRSQNDKIGDTNGDRLSYQTGIHSFRGYLSELRIFRNA